MSENHKCECKCSRGNGGCLTDILAGVILIWIMFYKGCEYPERFIRALEQPAPVEKE